MELDKLIIRLIATSIFTVLLYLGCEVLPDGWLFGIGEGGAIYWWSLPLFVAQCLIGATAFVWLMEGDF